MAGSSIKIFTSWDSIQKFASMPQFRLFSISNKCAQKAAKHALWSTLCMADDGTLSVRSSNTFPSRSFTKERKGRGRKLGRCAWKWKHVAVLEKILTKLENTWVFDYTNVSLAGLLPPIHVIAHIIIIHSLVGTARRTRLAGSRVQIKAPQFYPLPDWITSLINFPSPSRSPCFSSSSSLELSSFRFYMLRIIEKDVSSWQIVKPKNKYITIFGSVGSELVTIELRP